MRGFLFTVISLAIMVFILCVWDYSHDSNKPQNVEVGITDDNGFGSIYVLDKPLSRGGGWTEGREGSLLKNVVEYSYVVGANGKSINAHYVIHKNTLTHPAFVDKVIPIETTKTLYDIGYGFKAYAVLVK
jgi:hypothetical protein